MKNFFPPGTAHFTFNSPGTLVACSFVQTTFQNVEWLSDQSYNTLALHIHGVAYKDSEGQTVEGDYVPIIFENLPHTVVRDREAYGLPAIYGEVNVKQNSADCTVTASFDGMEWVRISLHALQPCDTQVSETSSGAILSDDLADLSLLAWRSMPSFDDQEDGFAVQVLRTTGDRETNVRAAWTTADVSIRFPPRDKSSSSIFANVVERLSEIPIYRIMSAKVVEGNGVPSFSCTKRLR